jgi:ABC-type branched-subunit amino acid transport system substrate-binding protein
MPKSTHRGSPRAWPLAAMASILMTMNAASEPLKVQIAFVGSANSAAHHGALLGLDEARAQGEFLGQLYALTVVDPAALGTVNATAIIVAGSAETLAQGAAQHPSVPVFNVTLTQDALRADCRANLLHVIPSDEMRARALAQWQQAHPDATGVQAQTWHREFEKYAAAQLNKRFKAKHGVVMNDEAWSGWAAVKLLSDMIARSQTNDSSAVLTAIRADLAFDGQKGVDLNFADNGQLRQPLLLVADDKLIGEAPVRGVADIEDLDSLNTTPCAK